LHEATLDEDAIICSIKRTCTSLRFATAPLSVGR
jgi:hypothetical protein